MPKSVLEAIKMGFWDFEPPEVGSSDFSLTDAMPGTKEKLQVMAERVRCGLPLWHPEDRDEIDEGEVVESQGATNSMELSKPR